MYGLNHLPSCLPITLKVCQESTDSTKNFKILRQVSIINALLLLIKRRELSNNKFWVKFKKNYGN